MKDKIRKNDLYIKIPEAARNILTRLRNAGHEAYVVGGCVRDAVLGRIPDDWDITTSALPPEVKSLFKHTVDTGIQHGTVMVLSGCEGYEVTTYRRDGKYSDSRRPDNVEFTPSLEEDLKRRDFTINAFAYNEETGLVDLFDGLSDLKNGIIRCVGDPEERFSEDALRIMRAVRFAAQLSFEIEPATLAAIEHHAENLGKISMERIRVEFEKTLMSGNPGYVNMYKDLGLAEYIVIGEAQTKDTGVQDKNPGAVNQQDAANQQDAVENQRDYRIYQKCFTDSSAQLYKQFVIGKNDVLISDNVGAEENGRQRINCLRLAAFFSGCLPEEASLAMRKLTYDNKTRQTVVKILENKDRHIPADIKMIKRALRDMGPELLSLVWEYKTAVMKADTSVKAGDFRCMEMRNETMLADAIELTEEIINSREAYNISMLEVNGSDIIAAGVPAGAEVGKTLNMLLEAVINEPGLNRKEKLLALVRR